MSTLAILLFALFALGVCGVWLAVTWPVLQWTLAWLERRRDRALAELDFGRLPVADITISPDLRLHVEGASTDGATTSVNIPDAPCVSRSDADTGTPGDHT